jgi:hypothetical protein
MSGTTSIAYGRTGASRLTVSMIVRPHPKPSRILVVHAAFQKTCRRPPPSERNTSSSELGFGDKDTHTAQPAAAVLERQRDILTLILWIVDLDAHYALRARFRVERYQRTGDPHLVGNQYPAAISHHS